MTLRTRAVLTLAAAVLGAQQLLAQGLDSAQYSKEIDQWKAYRHERLTSETGYLALTGLFWVPGDGCYTLGSDPSCDMVFPGRGVPPRLGMLTFDGDVVNFEPAAEVTVGGAGAGPGRIRHDHEAGYKTTELEWGTLTWWVIKRGERFAVRLRDTESPTLREFKGVERYATDPSWRVEGRLEPYDPPKYLEIVDIHGNLSRELCPGALVFEHDGRECRLDGTSASGGKKYFVIFGDMTSGNETYAGGRFLYVDAVGEDGKVIIDFNKAYTPWCAFSAYTTCPLPPEQNRLSFEVTAGEKDYAHDETSDQ